jgi:hypothetical protein
LTITIQNPAQDMLTNRRDISIQFMSKKNLASTRVRLPFGCHYLAVLLSIIGIAPAVSAQPSNITYNYGISFTGAGCILASQTSYSQPGVPDPSATVYMSGTGTDTDTETSPGQYNISTVLNTTAYVTIPTGSPSTFSVSQPDYQGKPVGSDPGLTLTGSSSAMSSPTAPFYSLFPPAAGSDPNTNIGVTMQQSIFPYGTNSLSVGFGQVTNYVGTVISDGEVDLYYEDTPTLTSVLPMAGYTQYTFTGDAELGLTEYIQQADPYAEFKGIVTLTIDVSSAPDSSSTLIDTLTLLSICAVGAWQKLRVRPSLQPIRRG